MRRNRSFPAALATIDDEDRTIKLQRYDFGGRKSRSSTRFGRRFPGIRAYLVRGLALAAVLLTLLGLKRYVSQGNIVDGSAQAAATLAPDPVQSRAFSPAAADWQAPMLHYPLPDTFSHEGKTLVADYATDSLLNARVNLYLQRYRPETAVMMVADLNSGHVLALGERQDSLISAAPKLAFAGGFPAASLVKILTATAALESKAKEVTDSLTQLGGYHTLYRRQLLAEGKGPMPKITLEEAFSKSVNPAFGLLGMSLGSKTLLAMADRMGFNRPFRESAVAQSRIDFPDSGFSLAEAACGFTAKTTISPWHALQIARGAGLDGRLRPCIFPRRILETISGKEVALRSDTGCSFVSPENLPALQAFMQATVRTGTSRKGFHSILKASHLAKLEVGGKTGSLDGEETPGRFEWFIGYAKIKDDPTKGIALAIMIVHREYASIHASQLAALLIRDWLIAWEKARKLEEKARKAESAFKAA